MTDKDIEQAISDYLLWLLSKGYTPKTCQLYRGILNNFRLFINQKNIPWDKAFSLNALEAFRQHKTVKYVPAVRGLSWYLYNRKRIKEPIRKPTGLLPKIYEQYLLYYQQSHQSSPIKVNHVRRVLASFNDYMQRHNIDLCALTIENLDMFLKAFNEGFLPNTCKTYRHYLRGFLKYLYHDKGVLKRNLAPLVVGAPLFSQAKLPKFLRPDEVQKLFSNLRLSTPSDIRTYAMVHLAYCLGLRPKEISSITLDDISFHKRVIKCL